MAEDEWRYRLRDAFGNSAVEAKRNEYRNAVESLEWMLKSLRQDLDSLTRSEPGIYNAYRGWQVGDSSSGRTVTDFENALTRWELNVRGLIDAGGSFAQALDELDRQLETMRNRLETLNKLCDQEDARFQELSLSDIPF